LIDVAEDLTYHNYSVKTSLTYNEVNFNHLNTSVLIAMVQQSIASAVVNGTFTSALQYFAKLENETALMSSSAAAVQFQPEDPIIVVTQSGSPSFDRNQIALIIIWTLFGFLIVASTGYFYFFVYKKVGHPQNPYMAVFPPGAVKLKSPHGSAKNSASIRGNSGVYLQQKGEPV
jgi:hypothetical protein